MSRESAKLDKFQDVALDWFHKTHASALTPTTSGKVFNAVKFDGVYQDDRGATVIVEVALGGGDKELKSGPKRKMLADAFKLSSAEHFLRDSSHQIARRVLLVRASGVKKKIESGWNGTALAKQSVEVMSIPFSDGDEASIKEILKKCIEEQVDDNHDP
jgi:hypothetical protein